MAGMDQGGLKLESLGEAGVAAGEKRENKKPDSDESGLAVVTGVFFQTRGAGHAPDHRRQADPCQRARLTTVILTAAETWGCTEQFIEAI